MAQGGARLGAGRKKGSSNVFNAQKREALKRFNDKLDAAESVPFKLLRPEDILFRIANGLPRPDGKDWTALQYQAACSLVPYSIAKPASVQIHQVQRTDARTYTDEELLRIIDGSGGGSGIFGASQSPLLTAGVVSDSPGDAWDEASEASPADNQ